MKNYLFVLPGIHFWSQHTHTISLKYRSILYYFKSKITNAFAESFNAFIKAILGPNSEGFGIFYFCLYRQTTIFA